MKVLAVDPGYDRLGVAILEKPNGKETILFSDCLTTDKNQPINKRIAELGQRLEKLFDEYQPDTVAVETLFFNQNRSTAIAVAEMRGVVLYLAEKYGCGLMEFGPQAVKVAVTGYGASDKAGIHTMLKHLVANLPERALDDEYDAIAIGITALAHHRE